MACKHHTCPKVRCRLYGLVSGLKTKLQIHYACDGEGTTCRITKPNGNGINSDFGKDWDTLGAFFKLLGRAFIARILRKQIPTSL